MDFRIYRLKTEYAENPEDNKEEILDAREVAEHPTLPDWASDLCADPDFVSLKWVVGLSAYSVEVDYELTTEGEAYAERSGRMNAPRAEFVTEEIPF